MTILNSMKMVESSTNGTETTVGKEEIALYEQSLFFPVFFKVL